MKNLANYTNLTIRIARLATFEQDNHNGYKYLFVVKADEIPGCSAHGLTISEALNNFQQIAKLWLKWFDNTLP